MEPHRFIHFNSAMPDKRYKENKNHYVASVNKTEKTKVARKPSL